ncbi:MAG TPA: S9 family peptidase, partial [Blastocatellia bacterium]|nr:S9 family peptidase [Blastocatellia bacterium]
MRRNQIALFGALLSLVMLPPAGLALQAKRAMTVEDVLGLRVVSDPRISPDGRFVAFVVTEADMKTNHRNSDVWIVPTDGGEARQLTRSPKRDDQPRWSPDSRRLAFLSDRDGKAQIYVISMDGGEPEKLTAVETAVQSFEWSPDGSRIAYIAADPLPEAREKEKKDGFDQIIVDSDFQYAQISIINLAAKKDSEPAKADKLNTPLLHVTELAWSPDGKHIAFVARNTPKLADSMTAEVCVISSDGAKIDNYAELSGITQNDRAESSIKWSPDGRTISYLSTSGKLPTIGPSRIHLMETVSVRAAPPPFAEGFIVRHRITLQPTFNGYIRNYEWSRDGRSLYLAADISVNRHIYRVSYDGENLERLTNEEGSQGPLSLSEKTGRIAYLKEDSTRPADVYVATIDGNRLSGTRQLTRMNPQAEQFALGRAETVRWKSSKDGREIEGVLIYPTDYQPGRRYPLITSIHGGPEGAYELTFMAAWSDFPHVYAARGYACFFPNFRGSSNYGAEFAALNVGDLGGGDYQDVMSGIDYLIQRGIADPARLGVKGWSYGGYLSGWIIGHTDRFKAAVFGAGLSNAVSYYSQADIQYQRETLHQGTPWRNRENMIERSPVFYLQNAKTPSLIFHGEKDERVPLPQSLETYMGLKKAGVTTQLVIYPREPHTLREPKHQLDKMRRELDWFEKYLQDARLTS